MTFDLKTHNQRMVDRFIWLDSLDTDYSNAMLERYRKDPNSPNPNILNDVRAELARQAAQKTEPT
jgi:hypothetical protein